MSEKIKRNLNERPIEFCISNFDVKTGIIVLMADLNFRNGMIDFSELVEMYNENGKDYLKVCIDLSKKTNKNYRSLKAKIKKQDYKPYSTAPLNVVDIVDAAKMGKGFLKFVEFFYKENKGMLKTLRKARKIIETTTTHEEMEMGLAPLRNHYYALTAGNTRTSILLETGTEEDDMPIRGVVLSLEAVVGIDKELLKKGPHMETAVKLAIMGMIAADNNGNSKSMAGPAEEQALFKFSEFIHASNLIGDPSAPFNIFYTDWQEFYDYSGYKKDKILSSIIVSHANASGCLSKDLRVRFGQKALVNGCLEPFFSNMYDGSISFVEKNAFTVSKEDEMREVIEKIVGIHTYFFEKYNIKLNGDALKVFISGALNTKGPDTTLDASGVSRILDDAVAAYESIMDDYENVGKILSKANKLLEKAITKLNAGDVRESKKLLAEAVMITGGFKK